MKHIFPLFIVLSLAVHAQTVSLGIKAGVPVTSPVPYANLHQNTGRWTVGLTAEFHLIDGLSAEADALFRGYSFTQSDNASADSPYRLDAKAWDFPFLLKYRLLGGPVHPFVDAGYSLIHETFDEQASLRQGKNSHNGWGPVGGIGVEFKCGRVRLSPEARYTHLFHSGLTGSNGNLLTLLVGITF